MFSHLYRLTESFVGSYGPSRYDAASHSPTFVGLSRRQASLVSAATSHRMHRSSFVGRTVRLANIRVYLLEISPFIFSSLLSVTSVHMWRVQLRSIKCYSFVEKELHRTHCLCILNDYGCADYSFMDIPLYLDVRHWQITSKW